MNVYKATRGSIKILGVKYWLKFDNEYNDPLLKERDGYCDDTSKTIVITNNEEKWGDGNFRAYQCRVIRHEVIHAYFSESGLSDDVNNPPLGVPETYVDWFAIQFPKIFQTFRELGVLTDDSYYFPAIGNNLTFTDAKQL